VIAGDLARGVRKLSGDYTQLKVSKGRERDRETEEERKRGDEGSPFPTAEKRLREDSRSSVW